MYVLASWFIRHRIATLQWIFLLFSGIKENIIAKRDKKIEFWEIFISGARGRNVPQQYVNIVFFASLLVNRYWNIYLYCVVIKQNISAQNSHKNFFAKNALITPFRVNYPKYAKGSLIITLWPEVMDWISKSQMFWGVTC